MVHEGIKIHSLVMFLLFMLPLAIRAQEGQLLSVYHAEVNDPVVYGKTETHSLEFYDQGQAFYKRRTGKGSHCDSIIPANYIRRDQQLIIQFPDREDWILSPGQVENFRTLTREDGFYFLQPVPPSQAIKPKVKDRKLKRQRQRCPDF